VAVPTVVPPLVQVVGAAACGPKTVKVIVPVAPAVAPDTVELIEPAEIAAAVVSLAGPDALAFVAFLTTVELIPEPQELLEPRSVPSPS
jgi:hypothetical protein